MARFWEKVEQVGVGECWPWQAATDKRGYGRYQPTPEERDLLGKAARGMVFAHRLAWALTHGPIPDGLHVLHGCDNPPCVNPSHLWLGTHADNMADMARKGRSHTPRGPRGEAHHNSRLTNAQALQMRAERRQGVSCYTLAKRYGVTKRAAQLACYRRPWMDALDGGC